MCPQCVHRSKRKKEQSISVDCDFLFYFQTFGGKELAPSAVGSLEARSMLSRWLIAAWLSGYSHAKRTNLIIDLESFEENVNKLTNYCYDEKNFKVPIMEAIVRVLGK